MGRLGIVFLALAAAGCTVALGARGRVYQLGLGKTYVRSAPEGLLVHRVAPGLDLRLNTGDSGLALGWSERTYADGETTRGNADGGGLCRRGGDGESLHSYVGLCWLELPLGSSERNAVAFRASHSFGAWLSVSMPGPGLGAGYEHRTLLYGDPDTSGIWSLLYSSRAPEQTTLRRMELP